jgi:hypothetical protein
MDIEPNEFAAASIGNGRSSRRNCPIAVNSRHEPSLDRNPGDPVIFPASPLHI